MKEHAIFFGSVCLCLLVVSQIPPLQAVLMKNYFSA